MESRNQEMSLKLVGHNILCCHLSIKREIHLHGSLWNSLPEDIIAGHQFSRITKGCLSICMAETSPNYNLKIIKNQVFWKETIMAQGII